MKVIARIKQTGFVFVVMSTAIVLSFQAVAEAPAGNDSDSTVTDADSRRTSISVDAVVEDDTMAVGRQFDVTFVFRYPPGTRVYFPENPETRPLVAVRMKSDDSTVIGTSESESHTISLLAVKAGDVVLKPFEVPVVTSAGEAAMVMTPEVRLTVKSMIGNEEAPELASPGSTAPVTVMNVILVWGLAALLTAALTALAAVAGYRRWRAWADAHKPPPPPVPPHETAYRRISEIEAMGLVDAGDFKTLALLLSEVIRAFVGARLGFSGEDSTTWETIDSVRRMQNERLLGRLQADELEDFLGLCDLIKFAKFEPSQNDASSLLRRSRSIVDDVMQTDRDQKVMESPLPDLSTSDGDKHPPEVQTESEPCETDKNLSDETKDTDKRGDI